MLEKSFFEYLTIANLERIHTQILAWIFSENFDAISMDQRNELLREIFKMPTSTTILKVITEYDGIDLYIKSSNGLIITENKLRSSQHSAQLERYREVINDKCTDKNHFFFLTLANEQPQSDGWKNISYQEIYNYLYKLVLLEGKSSGIIFLEYLKYLKSLTHSYHLFTENHQNFKGVFKDGTKKKSKKNSLQYQCPTERFISDNQLETLYQISFFRSISKQLEDYSCKVFEHHGSAILDIIIDLTSIRLNEKPYKIMLELQGKTLKFAIIIIGEEEYEDSNPIYIADLIPKMETLALENKFGYKKVNSPKTKAYMSISKKTEKPYWEMSKSELLNYLNNEIVNAQKMTTYLQSLLEENLSTSI